MTATTRSGWPSQPCNGACLLRQLTPIPRTQMITALTISMLASFTVILSIASRIATL